MLWRMLTLLGGLAILGALALAVWYRSVEFASWVAGVVGAMALAGGLVTRALTAGAGAAPSQRQSDDAGSTGSATDVSNTVSGDISGTVIQGRDFTGPVTPHSHGGDHVDFSGGTFHDPVTGKRVDGGASPAEKEAPGEDTAG
ncbi:hypothetical protein GCM10022402_30730 [Salinactinospora qingdaonensis]|uniref:Uncharacterized protein n=1 Tax=Salinactinospora qingdaonensis TaxID=702744 RepID=A0ABP7FYU4_9ACTN